MKLISKEQFIDFCQSIKDREDHENKINDMMQAIAVEFLYTSDHSALYNLVTCMELSFPNLCERYEKSQREDWTSPIAAFIWDKNSEPGSVINFYDAEMNCIPVAVANYGDLYDMLCVYEGITKE